VGKAGEVSPAADGWTAWQPLAGLPPLSAAVLRETVDGGQAFRWTAEAGDTWLGQWSEHLVRLRRTEGDRVQWSAPGALAATTPAALARYFGLDQNFATLADTLPWRSDPHLARCLAAYPGLRILRQPFGETLLGFLCSATKQIVQIKQMIALLAERHGAPLAGLDSRHLQPSTRTLHRLPTWTEIAAIPEADLRACLLGFRARYIAGTAEFLAANPGWLEETEAAPYAFAKARLCTLPGVGEKVADCVLLFGAGRLEAFPVDTWILKALARRYGLDGWKPAQVAQFGRAHFGARAGFAQQFIFAWERAQD